MPTRYVLIVLLTLVGAIITILMVIRATDQTATLSSQPPHEHPHTQPGAPNDNLYPAAPGQPAPGFPGTANNGTPTRFLTPKPTPALIEWTDWCFFEATGTGQATAHDCSSVYTTMASALVRLEMDEECVVRESRARIEALAAIGSGAVSAEIASAVGNHGWHRCPSPADPTPTDGRSLAEKCASNPELVEWINTWYEGGCTKWAQEEEEFAERALTNPEQSGCVLAQSLLIEWAQAVKGDAPGFLWQC